MTVTLKKLTLKKVVVINIRRNRQLSIDKGASKMKIKKFVSIILFAAILLITIVGITGCSKKEELVEQIDQVELTPIAFDEEEAFRIGDYQVGIDMFMLYAIDTIPGFISEFGEDCWTQESIDLNWRTEAPQKAFILYLTDIIASAVACDVYYNSTIGELDDSIKTVCEETAHDRYDALLEAGMPEGVISEESIYQYTCSTYRLSYVVNEISTTYDQDQESIQAAIMGMRDSIDASFDYDRNIHWDLVETIDYSAATTIDGE